MVLTVNYSIITEPVHSCLYGKLYPANAAWVIMWPTLTTHGNREPLSIPWEGEQHMEVTHITEAYHAMNHWFKLVKILI